MTNNITTQPDTDRPTMSANGSWVADGKKPASRLRGTKRRRSVPHLLLGALLVLACAAGFLLVSLNSANRRPVLALAKPVVVGQVLTAQDLKQANVAVDSEVAVVDANQAASLVGKTMSVNLPAGALLTRDAVSGAGVPAAGKALAALALKVGQFPPEVAPGNHVSVVFVPGQTGAVPASPPAPDSTTAWPAVVTSVTSPPNQQVTVVSVQLSQAAARQIAAVPAGQLSIVMLPGSGQ
ncbi:SAF domain-containing protein [Kibdelosporangium persicum]|uniref:Flagellar biosynthesis protein FlgA n=1 Tax=Kibdelosporangium persicum TaxID=2698649 RepID=A0ABX2F371_9PSEU|nr:SAF domain-containing protein [Kibdelosporangium persicum]NRN65757.1 Flagellar biosynthesis protein FlgA [Kibdelosporangium persicum]